MSNVISKIEDSFTRAMKGEESVNIVIWWWGIIAYLFAYFVLDKTIKAVDIRAIDILISLLATIYFCWHFYILRKCRPKQPKLSKEEKKIQKMKNRKEFGKKFLRKLFLQESITKWDPILITLVIDVFCIAHFFGYVIR